MKTRLISFLLLLVLIVTSIPMSALSFVSFAEESEGENTTSMEMTEEQYNALYVQDGLIYSLDFYKLNEHWRSYLDESGEVISPVPTCSNGADAAAKDKFINEDKKFFSQFNNTPDSSLAFYTYIY